MTDQDVTLLPDLYADWASSYPPFAHNALMEVEQAVVLALLPAVGRSRVLDAGCGTGRYARLLRARGAAVVGIDLSHAMLTRARGIGAPLVRGDVAALPLAAATFDLVLSGLCVVDVPALPPVLTEYARVLRAGGVVVYSTLHPRGQALGWTRTYHAADGTRTLPAHWHTRADHEQACARARLDIEAIEEPALTPGTEGVAMIVRARRRR